MKKELAKTLYQIADGIEQGHYGKRIRIALTTIGSELGAEELVRGAELAGKRLPQLEIVLLGPRVETELELIEVDCLANAHQIMEEKLDEKEIDGAVTLHYTFPLGIATVGRIVSPATGKEMLLATTTGTSDIDRVSALLKNTIYGIATARALQIKAPSVGILNIEGANLAVRNLKKLSEQGYRINFAESAREDRGVTMRGNDLLQGTPDIMVLDSLTGNLLIKVFSAFSTGGAYEASGYGYGPGLGQGYQRNITIISRASGAPVVANAIAYAAQVSRNSVNKLLQEELAGAEKAGLNEMLAALQTDPRAEARATKAPAAKAIGEEIAGIDILEIDQAKESLWQLGIYAETGMGCTGPVILVAKEDLKPAREALESNGYK